jgi:hypothetical protein
MKKIVGFLSLVATVSLSCNFMTGLFADPGLVEATGPILDMTVAASLDDQGQPVDAAFTYPADQPKMVVVVRLGEVAPGALTFNWYRVTESGDEALFEQTVAVEARDEAFSTGLNPGTLVAGTYKVVATFAGQSETIAWDVAESQTGDSTAPLGTSGSAAGGTPTPGPSGKTPIYEIVPEPGEIGSGVVFASIIQVNRADRVKFSVRSAWTDAQKKVIASPVGFVIQVRVGISGSVPDESRDFMHNAGIDKIQKDYFQDPCKLPGGSDLPGTSITVTAVALGYGEQTDTKVLGADSSAPVVQLVSEPSNGAKVKAGDKIELTAIAEEPRSGGSWQTGVSKIEIFVMEPSGEELLKKEYASYKDKSCDEKSWKQTTEKKIYEVPRGVKGDIRICAFGHDFAGNIGKKCVTYHTGDQLKGTLNHGLQQEGPSAGGRYKLMWQQDVDLSLSLAPDGTLSGTAQLDYVLDNVHFQSEECGTVHEWVGPIELTLGVTGTWTEDAVDFYYTTDTPIMVTKNFEAIPDCGGTASEQLDLAYLFGERFHAAWDGQAYTADETNDCSSADSTCVTTLAIHLAPPAPGVGFRPGAGGSCKQCSGSVGAGPSIIAGWR